MGSSLSTARQYIPEFLSRGSQNPEIETGANQASTLNQMSQANSRLNLINQLVSFRVNKRSKKSQNNLGDFQNISFSAYYFMAGRKFKNLVNQTQTFLFGDQLDLGFILSHKPVSFPYEISTIDTPCNYLQSLVNIRKDTLKLVKLSENNCYESAPVLNKPTGPLLPHKYNIEFVFDSDCDVRIKIHYFATEKYVEQVNSSSTAHLSYLCACPAQNKCICLRDENIVYKKGANILFRQPSHILAPSDYQNSTWQFNLHSNYYPIVIECTPVYESLRQKHAHVTLAYLDKTQTTFNTPLVMEEGASNEQSLNTKALSVGCISQICFTYQIKAIKQKQLIDGVLYSLQEVYGIERKGSESNSNPPELSESIPSLSNDTNSSEDTDTTTSLSKTTNIDDIDHEQELKGIECVICMCEVRDTLILPCRHLCLCKSCAINLRVQSNNCPICRIPFIALIQIKLFKKKDATKSELNSKEKLPVIKLESLNDINIVEGGHTDNFIIQIENKVSSSDQDGFKKEILLNSENKMPKLIDFYECVTLYEAFNETSLAENNKKTKSTKIKKPASIDFVQKINEVIEEQELVSVNPASANPRSVSTNVGNLAQQKKSLVISRSSVDVRKVKEINLAKMGRNSLSYTAQQS